MSLHITYLKATGQIMQLVGCPGITVLEFISDTVGVLSISVHIETSAYYVEAGVLTAKLPPPSAHHVFDYGAKVWIDPRTLPDLAAIKNSEINAARLHANRSSFVFAGKQIACDELSRSDIDGFNGIVSLTGALPPDWIGYWKAVDNTFVAIPDVATWTGLYAAMVAQGQANFAHSQGLKAAIAAATTAEEIDAIAW